MAAQDRVHETRRLDLRESLQGQPWRVQQRHIAPAAERCGIGHVGWHTFQHTFRSLLDETGAPDQSAAGTYAPHRYTDDDEHLRESDGEERTRGAPRFQAELARDRHR